MKLNQRFDEVRRQMLGSLSLLAALAFLLGCPNDRLRVVDECVLEAKSGVRASCASPGNRPGIGICRPGYYACVDGGLDRSSCLDEVKPSAEVCDGKDNDCDGWIDEAIASGTDSGVGDVCGQSDVRENQIGPGKPCKLGRTVCREGAIVCVGLVKPADEACDGVDNDCSGVADDSPLLFDLCWDHVNNTKHVGECRPGIEKCSRGNMDAGICLGEVKPSPEVCGDGKDNDCDGQIDEGCNSSGLRVECSWNGSGDIDCHLHNGTLSNWFYQYSVGETPWGDDNFYGNRVPPWGNPDSGVDDPTLDIDNITGLGPENNSIEKPVVGEIYTIGVHNYARANGRIATVSITCGKTAIPAAVFTSCPLSSLSDGGACASTDDFWMVAAVVFGSDGACAVTKIDVYSDSAVRATMF